ncbi:related to GRC3 Protein required for cell growth and possibly involved in rRNA processing [Rhynchosporium secalis]|uniref:Polynucleotide 5'-hydroxyl-kinase GRC3 n=1 Tax=Rhynchosporium secalis TaxID=38038 RepID=A0A1E1MLF6_RHYSE|nr:related to GRC3 Protein required for cell growth and possibly involved in rRNA processing [Rhynchosporium secalis]
MSSNKRQKLDISPKKPPLSAIAARQVFKSKTSSPSSLTRQDESATLSDTTTRPKSEGTDSERTNKKTSQSVSKELIAQNGTNMGSDDIDFHFNDESQLNSAQSREESPELVLQRPTIALSSFKPTISNLKDLGASSLRIRLAPGERLVIVGQYELCVKEGQITLMGATLQSSETSYRVVAASSQSLPVIRCLSTDVNTADIVLRNCNSGLEDLEKLSPLFGRLWNSHSGPLGAEYQELLPRFRKSTFQILFSPKLDLQSSYLQPLASPPEWNLMLSKLSETARKRIAETSSAGTRPVEKSPAEKTSTDDPPTRKKRVVMLCGPKSSGKSTFTKLLCNRLISTLPGSTTSEGIALLDLDPGQPEFSPPGQLALVHVQDLNFGTPFSHPIPFGKTKMIRAHSIASISPSSDPSLYMSCALDLFTHYRAMGSAARDYPLIINTPGWVFGTGLEILVDLISRFKPTQVLYMSHDGPPEVVSTLKEATLLTPLLTLPSQISEYTTRTAAHLRTMQAMSYFHLNTESTDTLNWSGMPLTSIPPWEVRYSGENPGILGVMCYSEQPLPELLAETMNGSLVAVVVIDDMSAVLVQESESGQGCAGRPMSDDHFDAEIRVMDHSHKPRRFEEPRILLTPKEQIPYFNPANDSRLDPRYSHSIGIALVRGIDIRRRRIQLLTPISPSMIEEINKAGKKIVLVNGKLDTPGWAYTEELNLKISQDKSAERSSFGSTGVGDDGMDLDDAEADASEVELVEGAVGKILDMHRNAGDGFQDAPWVERLDGSKGRGVGSRVWRVRRDLGRVGDGGE